MEALPGTKVLNEASERVSSAVDVRANHVWVFRFFDGFEAGDTAPSSVTREGPMRCAAATSQQIACEQATYAPR